MPQASRSLKLRQSPLAEASAQLEILKAPSDLSNFDAVIQEKGLDKICADGVEILQVNLSLIHI